MNAGEVDKREEEEEKGKESSSESQRGAKEGIVLILSS